MVAVLRYEIDLITEIVMPNYNITSIFAPNNSDQAFERVPQVADVSTPIEIIGNVSEIYAESRKHHHWHDEDGPKKCAVLKQKTESHLKQKKRFI